MTPPVRIERYQPSLQKLWDDFVRTSKNGTFLFEREYMDYHRDRFADHSLMAWSDDGELLAVLPANEEDGRLISHGGLTYGGFVTNERMTATRMLDVFGATRTYAAEHAFGSLVYKAIPEMYHTMPAAEDLYALYRYNACLVRRDLSSALKPACAAQPQTRRLRGMKKALQTGVKIEPSEHLEEYWRVLEENLMSAHQLKPVHTVHEMALLRERFPEQISLFCATLQGEIVAGAVMYETATVAHVQYSASSPEGRSVGALDLLFNTLIHEQYRNKPYFDFGVSTEDCGRHLNDGLVGFKEGFGARTIVHDFYEMKVRHD